MFLAARGRCARAATPLRPGWHADHVEPVSAGGATEPANGQALCPRCNLTRARGRRDRAARLAGRVPRAPRRARRAPTSCSSRRPERARRSPRARRSRGRREQIVVVCPTTALRAQWADAADRVGLHLDPRWRNADGAWRGDVDGVVVTYQQVASAPDLFAHHLARPTFVVLDEIHHAGESATWGTALRAAFDGARHRLALSGTPFRSDARAIPFVRYDDERRCAPDFVYGYGEAVGDGVCRPLAFRLLDATLRWRVDAQETIAAFADELDPTDDARRLRTAIDPTTPLLPQMLRDADALLVKARAVIPDAAGLVLCDDRAHARATAALLRTIAGEKPVVVVSDEPQAHTRIDRFARAATRSAPRWLVAVNMVSEGVDVPRLVLAAYATVKRTDLFFRQAVGRVVRRRATTPTTSSPPSSCPPTRR